MENKKSMKKNWILSFEMKKDDERISSKDVVCTMITIAISCVLVLAVAFHPVKTSKTEKDMYEGDLTYQNVEQKTSYSKTFTKNDFGESISERENDVVGMKLESVEYSDGSFGERWTSQGGFVFEKHRSGDDFLLSYSVNIKNSSEKDISGESVQLVFHGNYSKGCPVVINKKVTAKSGETVCLKDTVKFVDERYIDVSRVDINTDSKEMIINM